MVNRLTPGTWSRPSATYAVNALAVIDRVSAGIHPSDQARDLQMRDAANRLVDLDEVGDEPLKPCSLGQLKDRREARARHEFGSSNTALTS